MTLTDHVRMLLDEAGTSVFWTASHLQDAINASQLYTLPLLPRPILTTASWVVEAGTDLAIIPTSIMIPKYVEDTSRQFFITTPTKLEQYNTARRGMEAGIPEYFVLWDANKVR